MAEIRTWISTALTAPLNRPKADAPAPEAAAPATPEAPQARVADDAQALQTNAHSVLSLAAYGTSDGTYQAHDIQAYVPGFDQPRRDDGPKPGPQPAPNQDGGYRSQEIQAWQPKVDQGRKGDPAPAPLPTPSKDGGYRSQEIQVWTPKPDQGRRNDPAPQPTPNKDGGYRSEEIQVWKPSPDQGRRNEPAPAPQPQPTPKDGGYRSQEIEVYQPKPDQSRKDDPAPAPQQNDPTPAPQPSPVQGGGGDPRQAKLDQIRAQLNADGMRALDQLGSKLDDVDLRTGKSLLENLADFAGRSEDGEMVRAGLTKKLLLSELVQELAEPGLIHQSNHSTCAATSVQYLVAIKHPAEYARLVTGLMNGGQVDMASGKALVRDSGSLDRTQGDDRNDIDRILQTSFMDQSELGDYDNRMDVHIYDGSQGLTQADVTNLVNNATNGADGRYETVIGSDATVLDRIQAAVTAGRDVPVGLYWSKTGKDAMHELLVTKIEGDNVYLRNPWGKDEQGQTYAPDRQVLDGKGDIVMSLADFRDKLAMMSV